MTEQHYIVPPAELVHEWGHDANLSGMPYNDEVGHREYEQHIATRAAQWGADQELEACCEILARELICDGKHVATDLRMIRRPKPLSLKEQALAVLEEEPKDSKELIVFDTDQVNLIRRALEQLDD
jgi:Zn-dependent peptidase ImmA (M78 family)